MTQPYKPRHNKLGQDDWRTIIESIPPAAGDRPEEDFNRRAAQGLYYIQDPARMADSVYRLDARIDRLTEPPKSALSFGSRRLLFQLAAAAVFLALFVAAALFLQQGSGGTSEQLFAAHFEPMASNIPMTGLQRKPAGEKDLLQEALLAYEKKDYQNSIPHFQQYLNQQPNAPAVRLYFGISLLGAGRSREAMHQLDQVYRQPEAPELRPAAQWYLALAHLRLDDKTAAVMHLQELSGQTESRFYGKKAESLLQEPMNR